MADRLLGEQEFLLIVIASLPSDLDDEDSSLKGIFQWVTSPETQVAPSTLYIRSVTWKPDTDVRVIGPVSTGTSAGLTRCLRAVLWP